MLVCARLRHVAGTQWGGKKYMSMKYIEMQGTVKYYAQIRLQIWQNSVCTGQGNLPLIIQ